VPAWKVRAIDSKLQGELTLYWVSHAVMCVKLTVQRTCINWVDRIETFKPQFLCWYQNMADNDGSLWSLKYFHFNSYSEFYDFLYSPTFTLIFYIPVMYTFQADTNYRHPGHICTCWNYPLGCCTENQLDAQIILSIFHELLHVLGVSRTINRRYNRMFTTIGTYYYF